MFYDFICFPYLQSLNKAAQTEKDQHEEHQYAAAICKLLL